jgi:hypothetical protein
MLLVVGSTEFGAKKKKILPSSKNSTFLFTVGDFLNVLLIRKYKLWDTANLLTTVDLRGVRGQKESREEFSSFLFDCSALSPSGEREEKAKIVIGRNRDDDCS